MELLPTVPVNGLHLEIRFYRDSQWYTNPSTPSICLSSPITWTTGTWVTGVQTQVPGDFTARALPKWWRSPAPLSKYFMSVSAEAASWPASTRTSFPAWFLDFIQVISGHVAKGNYVLHFLQLLFIVLDPGLGSDTNSAPLFTSSFPSGPCTYLRAQESLGCYSSLKSSTKPTLATLALFKPSQSLVVSQAD